MTENTTPTENRPMSDVSHTHPDTDRPFGEQVVFARGPVVAADGGEPSETGRPAETKSSSESEPAAVENPEADGARMRDVDHEPPNEAAANRVFERGHEGRDGSR